MKRRIAVLAVGGVAALAALPGAASAGTPQPMPICVNTNQGTICTYDVGGVVNDPVGYACGRPEFDCGSAPTAVSASVRPPIEPYCVLTVEGWVCLP